MSRKELAGEMIKQINDAIEKKAAHLLGDSGITKSQLMVLLLFLKAPDDTMTLKEVERALHCAQSTAHGLVTRLEEKKLVISKGDPEDRRIRVIQITEAGKEHCRETEKKVMMLEKTLLEPLDEQEQEQFLEYLSRVKKALV